MDIHVHAVPRRDMPKPSGSNYPQADELRAMYDRMNIERGVLMPPGAAPEGTYDRMSQREAADLANERSDVFIGWFCNIDPRQGSNGPNTDFSYYLSYYRSKGAVGVGEVTANLYLNDPRMMNLLFHCEKMHMPVLMHFGTMGNDYGVVDSFGLPRLEEVLKTFPKLIVIGHSPRFWAQLGGECTPETLTQIPEGKVMPGGAVPRLMEAYPNLWVEFSSLSGGRAILRDAEFTYDFFRRYAKRIMYGTDFHDPRNLESYDIYSQVASFLEEGAQSGRISEQDYRRICRENALRLIDFGAGRREGIEE